MSNIDFWSDNPCDGQSSLSNRQRLRYGREGWLPRELAGIGRRYTDILEIGCGQGTDAIEICAAMRPGGRYTAIDYSPASVAAARVAVAEGPVTPVRPSFMTGDATRLGFEANTFDAAYSMGVLHHIDDTDAAISEIHRVIRPGGAAYITLYNTRSIKVRAAIWLRQAQRVLDRVSGTERCLLPLARKLPDRTFGTMVIECFGVPVLKAYTLDDVKRMFGRFEISRCIEIGHFNAFWFVEALKPA
jgi:SAM-dependent methyltransferase